MPHVALVPFTGYRVRERRMLELGMSLPGLQARGDAIGRLPALGLLTLAGMTPEPWTCSYHDAPFEHHRNGLLDEVLAREPTLVAISALTASIHDAYAFSRACIAAGVP